MKIKSVRNMMTVVGLAVGFAAASLGQVTNLKAVVGFPFTAQGQKMTAGSYNVTPLKSASGTTRYVVRNVETREAVMVSALFTAPVGSKGSNAPRLTFRCGAGNYCALSQVWDGSGEFKELVVPNKGRGKDDNVMEIALSRR